MNDLEERMGIDFDPQLRRITWQEYKRLEDRFLELTEYIPLSPNFDAPNYKFGTPRAGAFGLDCCTWLETLLKELLHRSGLDDTPGIVEIRRKKLDMDAYKEVFGHHSEKHLNLSKRSCRLKILKDTEVRPFQSWEKGENPEWFRFYSKYKHNRYELAEKFTMGHALEAFAGLSVVASFWFPLGGWTDDTSKVFDAFFW